MTEILRTLKQASQTNKFIASTYNVENLPIHQSVHKLSELDGKYKATHWNDDINIIYVKTGRLSINTEEGSFVINERNMGVISARIPHSLTAVDGRDCEFVLVLINEMLFSTAEPVHEKYVLPMFHSLHPSIAIIDNSNPNYPNMMKTLRNIENILKDKPEAYELFVLAKFNEFLAYVFMILGSSFFPACSSNSDSAEAFRKMLSYIHREYSEKLLVEDIAAAAGVSRKHCYALFHQYSQMTPGEYLADYRLSISRNLLKQPNIPISTISEKCGFSHQSHFTNLFKKRYDITPKKYRTMVLKNNKK